MNLTGVEDAAVLAASDRTVHERQRRHRRVRHGSRRSMLQEVFGGVDRRRRASETQRGAESRRQPSRPAFTGPAPCSTSSAVFWACCPTASGARLLLDTSLRAWHRLYALRPRPRRPGGAVRRRFLASSRQCTAAASPRCRPTADAMFRHVDGRHHPRPPPSRLVDGGRSRPGIDPSLREAQVPRRGRAAQAYDVTCTSWWVCWWSASLPTLGASAGGQALHVRTPSWLPSAKVSHEQRRWSPLGRRGQACGLRAAKLVLAWLAVGLPSCGGVWITQKTLVGFWKSTSTNGVPGRPAPPCPSDRCRSRPRPAARAASGCGRRWRARRTCPEPQLPVLYRRAGGAEYAAGRRSLIAHGLNPVARRGARRDQLLPPLPHPAGGAAPRAAPRPARRGGAAALEAHARARLGIDGDTNGRTCADAGAGLLPRQLRSRRPLLLDEELHGRVDAAAFDAWSMPPGVTHDCRRLCSRRCRRRSAPKLPVAKPSPVGGRRGLALTLKRKRLTARLFWLEPLVEVVTAASATGRCARPTLSGLFDAGLPRWAGAHARCGWGSGGPSSGASSASPTRRASPNRWNSRLRCPRWLAARLERARGVGRHRARGH